MGRTLAMQFKLGAGWVAELVAAISGHKGCLLTAVGGFKIPLMVYRDFGMRLST